MAAIERDLRPVPADDVELASVLRALGDPVRLEIVRLIADGQRRMTGQIADQVGLPASTCSYHLKQLFTAGVTECRTEGTARFPALRHTMLDERFPGLTHAILATDHTATVH